MSSATDKTMLWVQLRTAGFKPHDAPYPCDVDNHSSDTPVVARSLGVGRGITALSKTLTGAMRQAGMRTEDIEAHPTFAMLRARLPGRARMDSQKAGMAIFSHYERLGFYQRDPTQLWRTSDDEHLVALLHLRHAALVPSDLECSPYGGWEQTVMCRTQLLDGWWATPDIEQYLAPSIVRRTLAHLGCIGEAAGDAIAAAYEEHLYSQKPLVPTCAILQWSKAQEHLRHLAAHSAASLSDLTDDSAIGAYDISELEDRGGTLEGIRVEPMPHDDESLVARVAEGGVASLEPARKPKAPPGDKHLLVEVTDQKLVQIAGDEDIGHRAYQFDGAALRWRLLVDEGTRLFYVEPVFDEDGAMDIEGFLTRAWQTKPSLIFGTQPRRLEVAKSMLPTWPTLPAFLDDRRVAMEHPKTGLGIGITMGKLWINETSRAIDKTGRTTVEALRRWAEVQQVVITGHGWYNDPLDKDGLRRVYAVLGRPEEHYTRIAVDTRALAAAVGRADAEDVIRSAWPRVVRRAPRRSANKTA